MPESFTLFKLSHVSIFVVELVLKAYDLGGSLLVAWVQTIESITLPAFVTGFLRSMSAIIFQGNITTGFILSIGLLVHSRIAFTLAILGYAVALWFNQLLGGFNTGDISYYNLDVYMGANSSYLDARNGAVMSAINIYGLCSDETKQTKNAWAGVGIGLPSMP